MFSPGTRKNNHGSSRRKDQNTNEKGNVASRRHSSLTAANNDPSASPKTPLQQSHVIPNRPSTGTPAPWASSRLSVLARIPPGKRTGSGEDVDLKPVYVGEFPHVVRDDQQAILMTKQFPGDMFISGGLDKEMSLAWVICRNRLFIWSYLSPTSSKNCIVLDLPSGIRKDGDSSKSSLSSNDWLICFLDWDGLNRTAHKNISQCNSAGVILCSRSSRTLLYWPDIYSEAGSTPVVSYGPAEESEAAAILADGEATPPKLLKHTKLGSSSTASNYFNSLIATPVRDAHNVCISLASSSSGELWLFSCNPLSIERKKVFPHTSRTEYKGSEAYPRSLIWHPLLSLDKSERQFFLLTDLEIQCFSVKLRPGYDISEHWCHKIISTDPDQGIQRDLAGQKRIWPLDLQIDSDGKVFTILIAIICIDRFSGSSYIEYSLLTMQYKSGVNISENVRGSCKGILERKASIQVIIPKARVEEKEVLFSMRLKIGGKPAGSVIILSGDGTATVSHYCNTSTRLYQFDLPYDAGKVLDASVFPSLDDGEDGAWVVLTEKAGIWAIPERAIQLGGVEPPERSLSRKGSSNERSSQEEKKNLSFAGTTPPRRASSEVQDAGDRHRPPLGRRNTADEESEALLNHLFNDFLFTGQVEGSLDKLEYSGAFEREGEANAFARMSKSIVDTLAKHWTTTRGVEIVALSVVSTQLVEKQQKHQKFLQFLVLSKCHDELCSRQRESLQIILEHGEKLAGMVQLRELQNTICQSHTNELGSYTCSENQLSGALWDIIQLVGERARRKTVLLMDRENAEVFYSKVSDIEELFYCLEKQLDCIIGEDMPVMLQFRRACDLSSVCVRIFHTAMEYRSENHLWYPPHDGLMPWYSQTLVRGGMWSIAFFMLQLSNEAFRLDDAAKLDFYSHEEALTEVLLEAYSGAITAKSERSEEQRSLLDEYWKRRDELLDALFKQMKGFFQGATQDSHLAAKEKNAEVLGKLAPRLLSIAKRHEGYQTLWSICCDLNDSELLRNLMHESVGPRGGFSNFVFKKLYDSKQYSKLMRFGEDFPDELAIFLKPHDDLRWLHELLLNQFYSASETLHALALSRDNSAEANDETDPYHIDPETSLADRKRFLNLSKIAAMAGKDADYLSKVRRIEADLNILKLQEEISTLYSDIDERLMDENQLLSPVDLINLCIKSNNRVLALRAFDVFAWTSSSFIKSNSGLLEECWRNAVNQDNWESIYQSSVAQGQNDEDNLHALGITIIFQASSKCYGPESRSFDGGFDVLPLRQESSELPSVESILMQHKDFPEAGKLMLTAIMLGSVDVGAVGAVMDDVRFAME